MRAVQEYGTPLIDDPARLAGVQAVGVDETTFLSSLAGTSTRFVTGIVAMPGPGRACAQLLDVVPVGPKPQFRSGSPIRGRSPRLVA